MTAIQDREDTEQDEDTRERVTVWDTGEVLYVHPVASLFPMMSDEEVDDLATDIKANGLAEPILLDQHEQLIDGRNRLEACRRAQVSPDFMRVTLDDPVALILSKNIARRHLSKGQAAMAVVKAKFCDSQNLAWGESGELARMLGVDGSRLSRASTVVKYAPPLVDRVLAGDLGLDEAHQTALEHKRGLQADEERARQFRLELRDLTRAAPDLASLVEDRRLSLDEARAAAAERVERERQKRKAALELLFRGIGVLDPAGEAPDARAAGLAFGLELMSLPDGSRIATLPDGSRLTEERLRGCVDVARALYARVYGEADDGETDG